MEIKFDSVNARKHGNRNKETIKSSLETCGAGRSIVMDSENVIIGGNGVFEQAQALGLKVKVIETDGSELIAVKRTDLKTGDDKRKLLALADNRTAELAEWDNEALEKLIAELPELDLSSIGFDEKSLADIGIKSDNEIIDSEVKEERADELQKEWGTELGQVWQIGNHLIACGDSGDESLVRKIIKDEKASCMFTDPPYGVSIGDKNAMLNSVQPSGRCLVNIEADTLKPEELKKMLVKAFSCANQIALSDSCAVYVCAPQGGGLGMMMMMMMMESGLEVRHILNWIKNSPTFSMGRLDYDYQHEPILYTWTKRHKCKKAGPFRTSLWKVDKPRKCGEHPTMKPVELYIAAYKDSCDRGEVVFEPFTGSGTAFIASEQLGLKCRGIELMPRFVAVALQRMKDAFPGIKINKEE
jgi:DNA modification methylase